MLSDPKWDEKVEVELDAASLHLLRAIDYIQQHGWRQGEAFGPNGTVCILEALDKTKGISGHSFDAVDRIRLLIGGGAIHHWNDACGRTKEEVIKMMREAAYRISG